MNVNSNNNHEKVQQLQNNLYSLAKRGNSSFPELYDYVYRQEVLVEAWNLIKARKGKNGIDDISLREIETYGYEKLIDEVQAELSLRIYKPILYKKVFIGKSEAKKKQLQITNVKDKIVQMAVKIVIEPIFEADFKSYAYGVRTKRNIKMALDKINFACSNKENYIVDAHIKSFVQNINQYKLNKLLEQRISDKHILNLIKQCQGAGTIILPLLENIYLHELDLLWEKYGSTHGELLRYLDDIVIICKNEYSANQALEYLRLILNVLVLELDPTKTRIVNVGDVKKDLNFQRRYQKRKLEKKKLEVTHKDKIFKEEQIREEINRLDTEKIDSDKIVVEKIETNKIEVEKLDTDKTKAEKIEAEKLEAEKIKIEKIGSYQIGNKEIESSQIENEKIEFNQIGNEEIETNIIETEKIEIDKTDKLNYQNENSLDSIEPRFVQTIGCFCGYKYRFGLYAAHSNISNSDDNLHFHNFTIAIYINANHCMPDDNYNVERTVQDWFEPLQGQQLNQTDIFRGKETTIEGMGDIFFDLLYEQIEMLGYELVKLSIYENPIRVYSVSRKRLDNTVNEISRIPLECIPIINLDKKDEKSKKVINNLEEELQDNYKNNHEYIGGNQVKEKLESDNIEKSEVECKDKLIKDDRVDNLLTDNCEDNHLIDNCKKEYEEILEEENKELRNDLASQEYESSINEAAITIEQIDNVTVPSTPDFTKKGKTKHITNILFLMIKVVMGLSCFASLALFTMYTVKISGRYPQGSDTFCHLYRANLILQNIKQGNWFPLYDSTWYNGVEIMRYWGPIPLYIIAGLEWLFHCSVIDAYVIFLGFLIVLGGCGWLLWGISYNKIGLSIVIGFLWFYMPENIRVVIYEGNLPRGVINALLPFYFYFVWKVMVDKKKKALFPLIFVTSLITLCHLGITIMLLVTATIFILVYAKINHTKAIYALGASISGVLLAGLWVVPALIGGAASGSSTNQVMKYFFESAAISLNPFTRLNGDLLSFYFGFSVFLICIFGIVFGSNKVKPGFITALILYICTTKSIYALFVKLPFSQFLWMIRFIPIGLAAAMFSFLMWKELKKWMVLLFCIFLIADCTISFQDIYFPKKERVQDVQKSLDERAESALITNAKEITNQRMAILDLSRYGSFAPFYVTGVGKVVNYTYGAGWEGANTATNIVNMNASVENGWYVYLFDRALELGNDTVLIPIDNLKGKANDIEKVVKAAKISGYDLVSSNVNSILFHKNTLKQFGVITKYENIAIGTSASGLAMIFPNFEEGTDININDYTYDELCKYHTIYLSGFVYRDKVIAEDMLLKLANHGVQIFIDMNRIPYDKIKKSMELFGVNSQSITLTDTFPKLTYQGNSYQSLDFSYDLGEWNTIYLDGLDQIDGKFNMTNKDLAFMGTAKNKNLHFIGLNLVYYLQVTNDPEIKKLVNAIFGMNDTIIPNRKIVPVRVKISKNKIKIDTEYDNVNTTLSSIDIFHSKQGFRTRNNLITVNSGSTVIDIKYPHRKQGILVTLFGIILAFLIYVMMRKTKEREIYDEISKKESN